MPRAHAFLVALCAMVATALAPPLARAGDPILSGTVVSASGEKMGGVTVSAKAGGTSITTTVFTDEAGDYYFPPMQAGRYQVWAKPFLSSGWCFFLP